MNFGPFYFAAPAALLALLACPALFWLLRATPPSPRRVDFPPLRLLLGIRTEEEARRRAPLWLVLLRALAAALAILGFARPSLAPQAVALEAGGGPTLIVVDDGWTSAPFWTAVRNAAEGAIAEAERAKQQVAILRTTPDTNTPRPNEMLAPADARAKLSVLEPAPYRPDRASALARLKATSDKFSRIIWLTDDFADDHSDAFADALTQRAPLLVRRPARTARAIVGVETTAAGIVATLKRASNGAASGAISAETVEGRSLGATEFRFVGETAAATIDLPPEIAARAARVRIVGEQSAGATRMLAGGSGRALVGLIDPGVQSQPLLSELYYVERAIQPFATPRRGAARQLVDEGVQALILPDASRLSARDTEAIERWLERGGLLVRFAGPRLANGADTLLSVRLRPGERTLGGALAWEKPQQLQPFSPDSPFFGLSLPPDVAVRRQVLAEPASEREARVWARLQDGSPLITAAARGKGLIVLFHISAGPDWSEVPLSGLFVELLRRTLAFAGKAAHGAAAGDASGPYLPERLLDGFGALHAPDVDAQPVPAEAFGRVAAGPNAPPGLYARASGPTVALDAARADEGFSALRLPSLARQTGLESRRTQPVHGLLLGAALAFLALDLILALVLAGALSPLLRKRAQVSGAALVLAVLLLAPAAHAEPPGMADTFHLAYIVTGDSRADRTAKEGLDALALALRDRTAAEPQETIGVDPAKDDLSPFPLLYWLAPATPARLSDAAIANLDRYMRLGGMLFVDTRDAGRATTNGAGPAAIMLQGVDAPPLEVVGADNVLTKSFYLLRSFPGRTANTKLYAESAAAASSRDGVAALLVGDGDWAGAWARQTDDRQSELSIRFGINLVMVALTGNYKSDQVHIPALLKRLGRGSAPE